MAKSWTIVDPPSKTPPPVPVRGMSYLAGSDHAAFPETIPYATESVLRVVPVNGCVSPEAAGTVARELIGGELCESPVIVMSGFPVSSRSDFSRFVFATRFALHGYEGGLAVRDKSPDGVSVASTEPAEIVISPHNENAYMPSPPAVVMFHCQQAATTGGEIPINDVRKIPSRLPPEFVTEMRGRGLRYWRRVPRKNHTLQIGWEQCFGTIEKSAVERFLESEGVSYHWEEDDLLRFWFERPVFTRYRGRKIWFNQLSESNAEWWLQHPVFQAMGGHTRDLAIGHHLR